jgi:predicted  nucleic acid-binding Zn-ribbon protein
MEHVARRLDDHEARIRELQDKLARLETKVGTPEEGLIAQVKTLGGKMDVLSNELTDMREEITSQMNEIAKRSYYLMGAGAVILWIVNRGADIFLK